MRNQLIALFMIIMVINCQIIVTHIDDEDQTIFPSWKLKVALRENGQGCYIYPEGCTYACQTQCVPYNGNNIDLQVQEYKYCCDRH